jgi:hypothetical protein
MNELRTRRADAKRTPVRLRSATAGARFLALVALCSVPPAHAGGNSPSAIPYVSKQQINSTTAGDQDRPAIASFGERGWVAVWRDRSGAADVVRSRRLFRAGPPVQEELEVGVGSPFTGPPAVARLHDDRSIVVWPVSPPNAGPDLVGTQGIRGRLLDSVGNPTGAELPLRDGSPVVGAIDVDASPGGGFALAWVESETVWIRRFDSQGEALGVALAASTVGSPDGSPRLTQLDDGGHVVVWGSNGSAGNDASHESVQWRKLDAAGAWSGPQQQANTFFFGHQHAPDVAPTIDGGFTVIWHSDPNVPGLAPQGEPIGDGIDLRYFSTSGVPHGPEVTVSLSGADDASQPALARGPDGELAATWAFQSRWVTARRLIDRHALGAELEVETSVYDGSLGRPELAIDPEGDFAIVWETSGGSDGDDDDGSSVQVRAFTVGRVGHWRLDEGSGDETDDTGGLQSNDATLTPEDPAWSWGRPGHGALAFDGGGGGEIWTTFDITITDAAVTLTAWLYLETPPSALVEPFASIYDAVQDNYVLYLDRDAAELRFKVTTATGIAERPGIPEAMLPLRQWIHVAGVYSGDGVASIYLDGAIVDQHLNPDLTGPVRSSPVQEAAFGRDGLEERYFFDGRIDDVELWRRALGTNEIRLVRGPFLYGDGFERGSTLGWSSVVP